MSNIVIDRTAISNAITSINDYASKIGKNLESEKTKYNKLMDENVWKGRARNEAVVKMKKLISNADTIENSLKSYAAFLQYVLDSHQATDTNISNAASNLDNGH